MIRDEIVLPFSRVGIRNLDRTAGVAVIIKYISNCSVLEHFND